MRKQKGFTLIELLIVVAIIGIIAAIAIPNLLDAIERSRQKRSTSEIKSMAGAMQSFSTDYGGYPLVGNGDPATLWPPDTDNQGSPAIVPDYIQAVPSSDGWKIPYTFDVGVVSATANPQYGKNTNAHFTLGSLGNDKALGNPNAEPGEADYTVISGAWIATPPSSAGTAQTHCYQADIVWADSAFMQAPDGKQKNC